MKNIVVLGSGFGGVYTLKYLRKYLGRNKNVIVTLISRDSFFLFTPLLHEVATGNILPNNAIEPIRGVLRRYFDEFYLADVKSVSFKDKKVVTSNGEIKYDTLVMALGAGSNFYGVKGAEKNCFVLKTVEDALRLKSHILTRFEIASKCDNKKEVEQLLQFVVIGGGPTGVELTAEISDLIHNTFKKFFDESLVSKASIYLVHKMDKLVPNFSEYFSENSLKVLTKKHKVNVLLGVGANEIGEDFVELDNGEKLLSDTVIWSAGVYANSVKSDLNFETDNMGAITVNEFSHLENDESVFVVGDMASFIDPSGKPLASTAQVATRQAKLVAHNISAQYFGKRLKPFEYKHSGTLLSLGSWRALAEIGPIRFKGAFAWWLWRTIYLSKLISFRKRIKVAIDWTVGIFSTRDISEY